MTYDEFMRRWHVYQLSKQAPVARILGKDGFYLLWPRDGGIAAQKIKYHSRPGSACCEAEPFIINPETITSIGKISVRRARAARGSVFGT